MLRRLVAMIPVLVLVTFGVFVLIHLTPGDPIDAMMGESSMPARRNGSAGSSAWISRSTSST